MVVQLTMPIAIGTKSRLRPSTERMMITKSRSGKAYMMSVKRISRLSTVREPAPAITPIGTPISSTSSWARKATPREMRAP